MMFYMCISFCTVCGLSCFCYVFFQNEISCGGLSNLFHPILKILELQDRVFHSAVKCSSGNTPEELQSLADAKLCELLIVV